MERVRKDKKKRKRQREKGTIKNIEKRTKKKKGKIAKQTQKCELFFFLLTYFFLEQELYFQNVVKPVKQALTLHASYVIHYKNL